MNQFFGKKDKRVAFIERAYMSRWDVLKLRYRLMRLMMARGQLLKKMMIVYIVVPFILYGIFFGFPGVLLTGGGVGSFLSILYLTVTSFHDMSQRLSLVLSGTLVLQLALVLLYSFNVHLGLVGLDRKRESGNARKKRAALRSCLFKNLIFGAMLVIGFHLFLILGLNALDLLQENLGIQVIDSGLKLSLIELLELLGTYLFALWLPQYMASRYFVRRKVLKRSVDRFRDDFWDHLTGNVLVVILPLIMMIVLLIAFQMSLPTLIILLAPFGFSTAGMGIELNAFVLFLLLLVAILFGLLDLLHSLTMVSIYMTPEPKNLLQLLEEDWMSQEFTIFHYVAGGMDEKYSCPDCFSLLAPPFITTCPYCPSEIMARPTRCPNCDRPLKFSSKYCPYCKWQRQQAFTVS